MATINWTSLTGGDWSDAADWSGGVVPGAGDDAVIQGSATYTVTVTSAEAAHSLTVNDPVALVSIASGGTISLGSDLDVESGEVELSAGAAINGGTLSTSGGTFLFKSGALDGVTYDGTLNLSASGAGIDVTGAGLTMAGAGGTGAGVIDMTGEGASLVFRGNQTLDNATVNLDNKAGVNLFHTDGTLTLGPDLTIVVQGGYVSVTDDERGAPEDTLVNQGTIDVTTSGGTIDFYVVNFVNDGAIVVDNGAKLQLTGPGAFVNAAGGVLTIDTGNSVRLQNLKSSLAGTVDGGGELAITRTTISGLTVGGGAQLVTYGSVTQTGVLTLGDGAGGSGKLTIAKTDTYAIAGNVDILSGSSTASRVAVDGDLVKNAGKGLGAVELAVSDAGVIDVTAGVLDFTKGIIGAGALEIGAGAALRFGGAVAATLTVTFEAPGGTLTLNRALSFAAIIDGFAPGGTIDLANKAATTATLETGDMLLVQNGAVTVASLQLAGVFTGDTFNLSSDGKGGTNITVTSAAAPLAQAIAGFAASPAFAHTDAASAPGVAAHLALAAPTGWQP